MTLQKAGIGAALPFLFNPATLSVVAIGAVGWGIYNLLHDEDEEEGDETPAAIGDTKVIAKVAETTDTNAPQQQPKSGTGWFDFPVSEAGAGSEADEAAEEAERKEMLRRTMSDLGKRSAAARAKRKAAASEAIETPSGLGAA
ncbi:hypothetical protein [Shimia sp. Alg240-R146]|uniref:hypothetical protein n=1 Tax=Shimia sp. Alg240-R146 TaxID=2993449 RepID=UPI0022E0FF82|nr:hypothetical protein [Shimia sp. Alg240-R146]